MRIQSSESRASANQRQGYVLIAVLIVIVVLTLAAYRYSDMMMAEYKLSDRILKNAQAKALADSGIHYAIALLSDPNAYTTTLNGNPYNNTAAFQDVAVDLGNGNTGYFSIISVNYNQLSSSGGSSGQNPWNYGVIDEASKINLNSLMLLDSTGTILLNMLQNPNFQQNLAGTGGSSQGSGMTNDIAASIVSWLGGSAGTSAGGADQTYYESLSNSYELTATPLNTLEELLLVQGITPYLLFGNDTNRNGVVDADEDGSGGLNPGWAPNFTILSRELNVDINGNPRVNINSPSLPTLYTQLQTALGNADLASAVVAYRMYSAATPNAKNVVTGSSAQLTTVVQQAMASQQPPASQRNISSIYALIGSSISVPGAKGQPDTVYAFPISGTGSAAQLGLLLDETTTVSSTEIPARINVNTASAIVLSALPGLQPADVATIQSAQLAPGTADPTDPTYYTPAWMYAAGITATQMAALDRYICGRTQVYRIQAIGYFEKGGPVARIEAVVDTNPVNPGLPGSPRILYYRDLTELGRAIDPRNN
jgi:type II secretory pathway component PulK